MAEKKPAEPMGLAVMRERFKYAATSQCVNWEPSDVESMALTIEALAEVHRTALVDMTGKAQVVDKARKVKP